jgi:uncharacterized protein (DUF736 family)
VSVKLDDPSFTAPIYGAPWSKAIMAGRKVIRAR